MGIHDLRKLLRDKGIHPDVVSLSRFKGKRVAIDVGGFAYASYAKANEKIVKKTDLAVQMPDETEIRNEWFKFVLRFIETFLRHDVTPVFVFDGEPRPEKAGTRVIRVNTRQKNVDEIEQIGKKLELQSALEKTDEDIETLRRKLIQTPHVRFSDLKALRKFVNALGLPWYCSKYDSEQLCSIFCIEGYCAATLSKDGDTLAFGCPVVLLKNEKRSDDEGSPQYQCYELQSVLDGLGMDYPAFVDMCIIMGCDFNKSPDNPTSSPMKQIGCSRAFELISNFGCIEDIPQCRPGFIDRDQLTFIPSFKSAPRIDYPLKNLHYKVCRDIFTYTPSDSFMTDGQGDILPFNEDEMKQVLARYQLALSLTSLLKQKEHLAAPTSDPHHPFHVLA